jgi:hypothetical protein
MEKYSILTNDRSGAQIQDIILCMNYCHKNNFKYIQALRDISKIKNSYFMKKNIVFTKKLCSFLNIPEPTLISEKNKNINNNKNILARKKYINTALEKKFLYKIRDEFDNNLKQINDNFFVVMHIRRGDVSKDGRWNMRYTPNSYYISIINLIHKINPNIPIYIFSESKSDVPFDEFEKLGCILKLDTTLEEAWNYFIQADIFIMASSSFSFVPALFNKNTVIYTWSKYFSDMKWWVTGELEDKLQYIRDILLVRNIYPLSYSIPGELIQLQKNKKHKMAPLIPGKMETYIYDNEKDYFEMYAQSKYGITHRKYGFDCLRHYEILASGCVPLFDDLDKIPKNTMITFPKNLLININDKNKVRDISDDEYNEYAIELHEHCKKNISCILSAKYFVNILEKRNNSGKNLNNIKILMLCGELGYRRVNYSRELLSIGLRRLLGANFTDFPKNNVLYKGCKKRHKYIGKGFTYGNILKDVTINRDLIEDRINSKEFDYIVYGKVGKKDKSEDPLNDMKYWKTVKHNYSSNNIIFLYGGDKLRDKKDIDLLLHCEYGICFVRELE